MKIEMIENHKIKVSLTVNDLLFYNIKPETLSPNSPELNKFLFNIMENVKKQTGFNPYCGQVIVEAIRSESGIVLYISRAKDADKDKNTVRKIKAVTVKSKKNKFLSGTYKFKDFENLCEAVAAMDISFLTFSKLYKYQEEWYFILEPTEKNEECHYILCEYCDDFGGRLYNESFLAEHGRNVAEGENMLSFLMGIKTLYGGKES